MSIEPTDTFSATKQPPNKIVAQALSDEVSSFRMMLDHLPMSAALLLVDDKQEFPIVAANAIALSDPALPNLLGQSALKMVQGDVLVATKQALTRCLETREKQTLETNLPLPDGGVVWFANEVIPVLDEQNNVTHVLTVFSDITQRKQQETLLQEQQEIISRQHDELNELSTPLLSISNSTLVLPLVGSIDTRRIQQLINTLLNGVSSRQAEHVIIDITGVPIVDTQVANALIQATQTVKLLGATVILSGIRPEVAQTLVGLGINLSTLSPQATLQSAISYSMRTTKFA